MSENAIHILMIGARRTGKSSVLSSMIDSFLSIAENTNFSLAADENTSKILDQKLINLRTVFDKYRDESSFLIEEVPTATSDEYVFTVSYQDPEKNTSMDAAVLEFHDVVGEHIDDEKTAALIKEADVLMVAVDTIHLMEENGKFSEVFHKSMLLKNIVVSAGFASDERPKMVLFVPLKCEKYYAEGRMKAVGERIEKEFASLIDYLKADAFKDRVLIAITPILTLGNIAFDRFGRDEKGLVIRQKIEGQDNLRQAQVYFKYIGDKVFAPKYCDQPVLYILAFAVKTVKKIQKKKNIKKWLLGAAVKTFILYFFGGFSVIYCIMQQNKNFSTDFDKISVKVKKSGDGYKMLQNPLDL